MFKKSFKSCLKSVNDKIKTKIPTTFQNGSIKTVSICNYKSFFCISLLSSLGNKAQ